MINVNSTSVNAYYLCAIILTSFDLDSSNGMEWILILVLILHFSNKQTFY